MHFEEFGKENEKTIVMLHGANFVHTFGNQYCLSDRYHLLIPHIPGYGNEAEQVFLTESAIEQLYEFIVKLGKKVTLVGFSLGAQLAVKLIAEHGELFSGAIIVSPWLIKPEKMLEEVEIQNEKQFKMFKNKFMCNLVGLMNGLPKPQRKEFVEQMQRVKHETVQNVLNNGITTDTIQGFENADFPIIAIAGAKEQREVHDSLTALSKLNSNCKTEIWEKAAHNIPPMFAKRFNELICEIAK